MRGAQTLRRAEITTRKPRPQRFAHFAVSVIDHAVDRKSRHARETTPAFQKLSRRNMARAKGV